MKPTDFSWINAALMVILVVIGSVVALAQTKKVSRERLQEAIKDLEAANDASKERASLLESQISEQKDRIASLNETTGRIRTRNDRLLRERIRQQEYERILIRVLREHKITVPARPIEPEEEA